MSLPQTHAPTLRKPLRLWPGVAAAVLLALVRFGLPVVFPEGQIFAVLGSLALAVIILAWWLFFSRAPWPERLGVVALIIVALFATSRIVHESIRGGMMGMMLGIYAVPGVSFALVVCAVAGRRLAAGPRRMAMVAGILLACGLWALLRTDGITGDGTSQLTWRWTPTAEERLLAQVRDVRLDSAPSEPAAPVPASTLPAIAVDSAPAPSADTPAGSAPREPATLPPAPEAAKTSEERPIPAAKKIAAGWPGFRGPGRDSIIPGVRIETDWTTSPPVEVWRRPIGPGWSSFAVQGDLLYTQEQRGDDEIVACYKVTTGEPVWMHRDATRFWESNGGAGPRATPTVSNGRVYALGATGILNALDAGTGAVVWSRNAVADTGAKVPGWGIAGSPIVAGDLVIVAVSGALGAYDLATGEPRWFGPVGRGGYSSPHLVTMDGVAQVLLLSGDGVTGFAPADGSVLWQHPWPGAPIVQPAVVADGHVLISTGGVSGVLGTRRIAVARGPGGWTVEERWTSNGLKPYFNDLVVHKGYAYGFDGFILASIDVEDGARKWKGGRYGHGQLVLLPDQDLLLVLSEDGELALVSATPEKFTEVARFPAIEGKTWNHPVLAGDLLLVRNGEEMAAFRLNLSPSDSAR